MATLAQLRAEPWWDREIVTVELDWLCDELCRRTGRPRVAAGTKGNEAHLRGAHRSQEWIVNSRYCTNRSYTVQGGLTAIQARHVAGCDFTPGGWGTTENRRRMVEQTNRLVSSLKAGTLPGVREVIGTLNGRTVVGTRADGSTFGSDDSHLDHWHLTFDRRRLTDRALMERIVSVALGEDDDMAFEVDQEKQLAYVDVREEAFAKGSVEIRRTEVAAAGGKHWGVETLLGVAATLKSQAEYIKVLADDLAELKARPTVTVDPEMLKQALREVIGSVDEQA